MCWPRKRKNRSSRSSCSSPNTKRPEPLTRTEPGLLEQLGAALVALLASSFRSPEPAVMQPLNPRQVQAYLRHLDSPAPRVADRAALDRLIQAQLRQVPFENLDVLLGRPIVLDADALLDRK